MKEKKELRLYVWTEFSPNYTDGLAFAIAESENEARELVETKRGYDVCEWGKLEVKSISKCGYSVYGGS